ncbi:MAG: hypothetical protein C0599_12635 [Salinivirgaceae bacterium]|nr:MAG: hypothetical protein C0599_12635 [Salinivirgaceae bacterium]
MRDKKTQKAEMLLIELKNVLLETMWGDQRYQYNNQKLAIPWLHEDYQYQIKKLGLTEDKEAFYMNKIEQIIGEYAEFY